MKILIIGGGNMGTTYAQSFLAGHVVNKENLYLMEHFQEKTVPFLNMGITHVFYSPDNFIREVDLIILAIKPQDRSELFPAIKPFMRPDQLVLSIMAGVAIKTIQDGLGVTRVVRAMPNLPAQVGMGMTGFTADATVSREQLLSVQNLLNTTGKSIYFDDEGKLDAVTAISGSGPAYVFFFMEAMINTAINMGFKQAEAELLVEQTFVGAVQSYTMHNLTCREWIGKVASRGGTTEAALNEFNRSGLMQSIEKGLQAAHQRAIELGS